MDAIGVVREGGEEEEEGVLGLTLFLLLILYAPAFLHCLAQLIQPLLVYQQTTANIVLAPLLGGKEQNTEPSKQEPASIIFHGYYGTHEAYFQ